jgi:hypothetical protein
MLVCLLYIVAKEGHAGRGTNEHSEGLNCHARIRHGGPKDLRPRVKAAYESAVSAAIKAAKVELLDGSVSTVSSV